MHPPDGAAAEIVKKLLVFAQVLHIFNVAQAGWALYCETRVGDD
jgi:hypothetical protein